MYKFRTIICLIFIISVSSCEDDFPGDCFKNTGDMTSETISMGGFCQVNLYDNIDLYIIPDTVDKAIITAGSNIIDKINLNVSDSILEMRNQNTCNWVRNPNYPVSVHLHTRSLNSIRYRGSGNIETTYPIEGRSFRLWIREGHGIIKIEANTHHVYLDYKSGTADVYYSGENVDYLGVFAGAYGKFDSRNLKTRFAYINQMSNNDLYTYAREILSVELHMLGNIYYKGEPDSIIQVKHGTGKLIPIN